MDKKFMKKAKRVLSGFVAAATAVAMLPQIPAFAETGAATYSYDGYDVEYSVLNEWDSGRTVEVKVTNTGDESILNWALKYDAEGEINNLWNAGVYDSQDENYIIKNSGWNYEIAPGQTVNFGYTLTDYEPESPNDFELCSKRVELTEGYETALNVVEQWDAGIKAELVINNTSDEPLEAWMLSFDSNFTIDNLWDARILESEDNHYTIGSEMWTNPIAAGDSKTIGFVASVDQSVTPEISNVAFSVVEIGALEINWNDDTDTDGDGLPDVCEKNIFGTDINNSDTDGDGLPDGYEVTTSYTDPAKPDTDDNGVNDSEEDFDEDGLTNLEEFIRGTNPHSADTDNDGLSDGDEVNIYITDPLVADTDEDGLPDGDEILLGTNPLVRDTDGNGIVDGKEKFHQTFIHTVENEDCAVTDVIVDMDCTGNINRTTSAESIMNTDIMCTEVVGLVGEPFEIETSSEFDKSTLTFKVDKEKLGDIPLDRLLFLWYNEEENRFEELETVIDAENSSVSTVTTHFSKYMLVDSQDWFDNWREIYDRFEELSGKNPSITAICVDCSGSMWSNDRFFKASDGSQTCYRNLAVSHYADAMFEKDKTSIITFDYDAYEICALTSDKGLLKSKAKFYSDGGTNANEAIETALGQLNGVSGYKSIILMSDGDVSNVKASNINKAIKEDIKIHTVALGEGANSFALKQYADKTGGEFFIVQDAGMLEFIYDKLSANNQLNFNDYSDKDGDGIPDDIEISGVPMPNGNLVFPDPNIADTDGDGLTDGEEVGKLFRDPSNMMSTPVEALVYKFRFDITSDPTLTDSDYDGIDDAEDTGKGNSTIDVKTNYRLCNQFKTDWNPDTKKNNMLYKNISYTMDYTQFFGDNTKFNSKISQVSSLMAALAYNNQTLVDTPDETKENSYVDQFLRDHGMDDVETYKLANMYSDQHITDVTFGHHRVEYDGQVKEIIAVAIRGTNGTVEEWSSNFDVGCDSIYDGTGLIPKNDDWKIKENHMGFDIAATRVIKLFNEYLLHAQTLDNSAEKTLWITGHSRGAGIANIVGSRLDNQYDTLVYAFATPKTTTVSDDAAKSHKSIFNIINSDDIIPEMPLGYWGFKHYGNDILISVADKYSDDWYSYVGESYVNNKEKKEDLLASFETLATDRNDCYTFHCDCHSGEHEVEYGTSMLVWGSEKKKDIVQYGESYQCFRFDGDNRFQYYRECQTTAYFMQYLAYLTAQNGKGFTIPIINAGSKAVKVYLIPVCKKYEGTKNMFKDYAGYIVDPHEPISYFLLSKYS